MGGGEGVIYQGDEGLKEWRGSKVGFGGTDEIESCFMTGYEGPRGCRGWKRLWRWRKRPHDCSEN